MVRRLLLTVLLASCITSCSTESAGLPAAANGASGAAGNSTSGQPSTEPSYWPTAAWQSASPDAHGFQAGALDNLAAEAAADLPFYTSLVIVHNGYIIHESYHDTMSETSDVDTKHHVFSVSKSINSLTVGRAYTRGDITDLGVTTEDIFPASVFATVPGGDARRTIRLRDALEMRSGIAWNEPLSLLQAGDPLQRLVGGNPAACLAAAGDALLCGILDLGQAYTPGTVWNYNTYDSYLVSGFFTHITGSMLADYAGTHLFSHLGITFDAANDWTNLTLAHTYGGGTLMIRTRDLAKLGMLVLYGGKWESQQLVSKEWLDLSMLALGNGLRSAFDGSGIPTTAVNHHIVYGMQWWRSTGPNMGGMPSITAIGLGGQMMHIFPEKDIIVILTCDSADLVADRGTPISVFMQNKIVSRLAP